MSQKANKTNRQPNNNNINPISNMDDCYTNSPTDSIVDNAYSKVKKQTNKNNKNNNKNSTTDCR